MGRPRKASDDQVFEAAYRIMQTRGPAGWTLADVAAEAGLTASALVQRFGSKRQLQVALIARFAAASPDMYPELKARARSPLGALRGYASQMACLAATRQELAHHLDYLRLDLTDPEMHVHFKRHADAGRRFIASALEDAIAAGELKDTVSVARLTRIVEAVIAGSLFTWASHQQGSAASWMRRTLDDLLAEYRPVSAATARR